MIFNLVPIIFILTFMSIGSKKGFVRELMAIVGLSAAIIITTGKLDFIAVEIADTIEVSPLAVAIIAFTVVLGLTFAVFKLAARFISKLIELQKLGQRDKMGGAIIGAIRGWLIVGTVLFVSVLMPLPRAYYELMDKSMLATSSIQTIQVLYNATNALHPNWPPFIEQLEGSLSTENYRDGKKDKQRRKKADIRLKDQLALRTALDKINYFFGENDTY